VVPDRRFDREQLESGLHCFGVSQSRAGHRHVKVFAHLRPKRASELPVDTHCIFTGKPPLLMGGRA